KDLGVHLKISNSQSTSDSFASAIKILLTEGQIKHDQLDAVDYRASSSIELLSTTKYGASVVWINKSQLNKTLDSIQAPRFNNDRVVEALLATDSYVGEMMVGTCCGWLVKSTWLSSVLRRDSRRKLKVIG